MKVIVFGASGMVGQGVLLECLRDARVTSVLSVGRRPSGRTDPRLVEIVTSDVTALSPYADQFIGADACFFCLGVSSVCMKESDYRKVTYELTLSVAEQLREVCGEALRFVYVSGADTDATGRQMWQRVKGSLENRLLELFPQGVMFRPGIIQPLDGVRSKTAWINPIYTAFGPLFSVLRRRWPGSIVDTREVGRAMLNVAAGTLPGGLSRVRVYESRDIRTAAA